MTTVEYFPPDGSGPVVFGQGGYPIRRPGLRGATSTNTTPATRKSSGQVGVFVQDREVSGRTVSLQAILQSDSAGDLNALWENLEAVFAGSPSRAESPPIGLLRVSRPGRPVVETQAEPVNSPQQAEWLTPAVAYADVEWLCPSPLWYATTQQSLNLDLSPAGVWTSPWTSPWESPASQNEGQLDNDGHVPVGIKVRFFGPQTSPRLVNTLTGDRLQLFGTVGAGEMVEVDTDGRTVVQDGVSLLGRWDYTGTWWQIRKGEQVVRAEANTSGADARTVVIFRNAYAGI